MITVPGSMPKMIFGFLCKCSLFLRDKYCLAEQKYQNNNQLPAGACSVHSALLQSLPADHSSARPGATLGADQIQLAKFTFLDIPVAHVCQLGYRSLEMADTISPA